MTAGITWGRTRIQRSTHAWEPTPGNGTLLRPVCGRVNAQDTDAITEDPAASRCPHCTQVMTYGRPVYA